MIYIYHARAHDEKPTEFSYFFCRNCNNLILQAKYVKFSLNCFRWCPGGFQERQNLNQINIWHFVWRAGNSVQLY